MVAAPRRQRFSTIKFILIALTIYGIINSYLFYRGYAAVKSFNGSLNCYTLWALFLILAFPAGHIIMRRWPSPIATILSFLGSVYLGGMVYLLLFTLSVDGVRLVLALFSISPSSAGVVQGIFWAEISIVIGLLLYGYRHALHFTIKKLQLTVNFHPPSGQAGFRIVMFSDIHLGTVIHTRHLQRIVQAVNQLKPQVILIPGDILDENLPPKWWAHHLQPLTALKAEYGVFATTGNHEYFINKTAAVQAIEATGVPVLEDQRIVLPNGVVLIGRRDITGTYLGEKRQPLARLLEAADHAAPVIVMDHQPISLQEAEQAGITLLLCGHTHDGQFWPLNLINRRIWQLSYGYRRMGKTHVYVTSGVGAWGPPIRIGTQAEIVVIDLVPANTPQP